jgi:drug/metabolite transporter (DMT)-like permease
VDVDLSLDYVLTLLAALLIGTGFVLQQHAAAMEPDSRFLNIRLITDLFRKPRWLAGIGCMVAGEVLAAWSIGHLELSFVEPLLTTNLIFALLLAVPLSGQSFRPREIIGAVILCAGVALLSASRSVTPIGLSFGSVSHWPAAAVIAAIAFILVHAGHRRSGRLRAALTGTAAGLIFGIQDALTRQTLEALQGNSWPVLFSTWSAYALVGAGAVGIWLMQNAFSAGPLQASLPAISAGEPLVGILLGVIIFGDRIQISPGQLAIQAGGVAAMIVGVITVASAPALSQLRERGRKLRSAVGPLTGKPHADAPADAAQDEAAQNEQAQDEKPRHEAAPDSAVPGGSAHGQSPNGSRDTPATPSAHPRPAGRRDALARPSHDGAPPSPGLSGVAICSRSGGCCQLRVRHPPLRQPLRVCPAGIEALVARETAVPVLTPPAPPQPRTLAPRPRKWSTVVLKPPSSPISLRTVTISAGSAQKSPQTHRIAAPIC